MTRPYTFWNRAPKPLNPVVAQYKPGEVERLVEAFQEEIENNPELAVDAFMSLPGIVMHELLVRELVEAPAAPVSQEIRRLVLLFARERAEAAANEILTGD